MDSGTPRDSHSCISFGSGCIMVTGGRKFSSGQSLTTTEIYDPEINSWYYSKDVPSNSDYGGKLVNWNGSPLLINRENMWKFEDGEWTLLKSTPSLLYRQKFAITLPDDFGLHAPLDNRAIATNPEIKISHLFLCIFHIYIAHHL